jgi:rhomboid protease GluP
MRDARPEDGGAFRRDTRLVRALGRPTPATAWLIGANVFVAIAIYFVISALHRNGLETADLRIALLFGEKSNPLIRGGDVWRLLSSQFLHAGTLHLMVNMLAISAIGPLLERLYGTPRMLLTYALSGLGGAVLSFVVNPMPSVGASGAVFGLLGAVGAFAVLYRDTLPSQFARSLMTQSALYIGLNVVFGLSSQQIDNAAHMGGLAVGVVCAVVLRPDAFAAPRWDRLLRWGATTVIGVWAWAGAMMLGDTFRCGRSEAALVACYGGLVSEATAASENDGSGEGSGSTTR